MAKRDLYRKVRKVDRDLSEGKFWPARGTAKPGRVEREAWRAARRRAALLREVSTQ